MMTTEQIELVHESLEQEKAASDIDAKIFYSRLFELEPKLRALFKGEMEQAGKIKQMIGMAVVNLDRIDELLAALGKLGTGQTAYGVREEDYETVGAALLWTLEAGLSRSFKSETEEKWWRL
jgi:hemoglobin-like flavoprotein